ncbi:MAG: DnaA ATPase domain-containing protein [Candidatus Brocadiia bacterium]
MSENSSHHLRSVVDKGRRAEKAEGVSEDAKADGDSPRQEMWREIQGEIKKRLGVQRFGLWFKQTELMEFDGDELVVGVPNVIIKQYLEKKYQDTVRQTARDFLGEELKVRFDVAPKLLRKMREKKRGDESEAQKVLGESAHGAPATSPVEKDTGRAERANPEFTFNNLVQSQSNQLPFLAAREIAIRTNPQFKFLLVLGEHGTGKTALLRAVAHAAGEGNIVGKAHYCRAEEWCNGYYHALQNRKTYKFRRNYRGCDLLIVDGIQFMEGKPAAQEELLHTAKSIKESGGRIVLSAAKHPGELEETKESFENLLGAAFWVELVNPPRNERVDIARSLGDSHGVSLDEQVLGFVSEEYGDSLRELDGAVRSLAAAGTLQGMQTVGLSVAQQILGAKRAGGNIAPGIESITEAIANAFDVSTDQLQGRSRRRSVCRGRQAAMYLARETTDLSLSDIGRFYGGRSHSTVKHSVEKAKEQKETNPDFADRLDKARKDL